MESEATMRHRVVIIANSSSCRIVPGHIVVGRDDTILFSAIGSEVRLFFPNPAIFEGGKELLTLTPSNSVEVRVVSEVAGSYAYSAYCALTGRFATGGSDGEIIIQT